MCRRRPQIQTVVDGTSSLSRELVTGRPTEVENVLGDLIDRAHGFGLAVPRLAAALTLRAHDARVAEAR